MFGDHLDLLFIFLLAASDSARALRSYLILYKGDLCLLEPFKLI